MEFTAKIIAGFLNGNIDGNPDASVHDVSKIEEGKIGTLTFLANPKYEKYIYETEATIVIVNKSFVPEKPVKCTLIKVENAYEAFASLLQMVEQSKPTKEGVESPVFIDPSAKVGEKVYIGAFAYIGKQATVGANTKIYPQVYIGDNVTIGEGVTLFAGVKIYHDCKIGNGCIVHAGAVIGGDGFGFAPQTDDNYKKIPQIGNVILEDNVEIGANTTIDRATMGSTILRRGVKLDNLVQVAHNVEIGENTVIASQTGISGSTKVGKHCMFGGQVGIAGHIQIGNRVMIAAQSGTAHSIKDNEIVLGSPASPISREKRSIAIFKNLPQLRETLIKLEKEVEALKIQINS